jgi:hypothetical protein
VSEEGLLDGLGPEEGQAAQPEADQEKNEPGVVPAPRTTRRLGGCLHFSRWLHPKRPDTTQPARAWCCNRS